MKTEVVSDVICNNCGESCRVGGFEDINFECVQLKGLFGFGSNKDGEQHEAELCEKCFVELTKNFKHPTLIQTEKFF